MELLLFIKLNDVMFFYISFIDEMMHRLNLASFLFNPFYYLIFVNVLFCVFFLS